MKKSAGRKLNLNRETVRLLQIVWVKGGDSTACPTESFEECSYGKVCGGGGESCLFASCSGTILN